MASIAPGEVTVAEVVAEVAEDPDHVRPDLAETVARHEIGLDAARPDAVERRRKVGRRTARENVADLVDDGSFVEYGPVVIAAQRRRRALDDLIARTPADGMIGGVGTVNGDVFARRSRRWWRCRTTTPCSPAPRARRTTARRTACSRSPSSCSCRSCSSPRAVAVGPATPTRRVSAGSTASPSCTSPQLSGLVPLVGINAGYCFAGNAAILGCCDVVIATADSNIGMGGPAMIEGGGLGVFQPTRDRPDGGAAGQRRGRHRRRRRGRSGRGRPSSTSSYFQGTLPTWTAPTSGCCAMRSPRTASAATTCARSSTRMFDDGSVLELRRDFGLGMVTALVRVEGRPMGVIANNPNHLAGAIDSDGADKAARFLQLCDAFGLPVVTLVDTPGMMVGPEVEQTALVRHCTRLFVTGANISVPMVSIVLRKSYGLGAQAMMGGSTKAPLACVAWPTGEFGGMGLEGAVRLGYRNELEAIADPAEREATFQTMVDRMYEHGKALNAASHFEIDDVIDPADSRRWIATLLATAPQPRAHRGKKRPNIDTW